MLSAPRPGLGQNELPPAPLDINRASVEQLERLPGIGPARAALIVRIRARNGPFRSIDELRALPRLSEKLFAQLRDLVTVVSRQDDSRPDEPVSHPNQPHRR